MKRILNIFRKSPCIKLSELKDIEVVNLLQNCDRFIMIAINGNCTTTALNIDDKDAVIIMDSVSDTLKQMAANDDTIYEILND